ncbi:hypothetical protein GWI33_000730, partial [Rhynchophorus ferrugineus]
GLVVGHHLAEPGHLAIAYQGVVVQTQPLKLGQVSERTFWYTLDVIIKNVPETIISFDDEEKLWNNNR